MMKQRLAFMAVMTASVLLAGQGYAQDLPPNGPFGAGQGAGRRQKPLRRAENYRPNRGGNMQNEMLFRLIRDPRLAKKINLSEEKTKTLKDAFQRVQVKQIDLQAELDKLHLQQTDLLAGLIADRSKKADETFKLLDEIGKINTELSKLTIERILAVRENLTDEQLKKAREAVVEYRKEMRENAKKRGAERGRPGGRDRPREGRERPGPANK